MNQNKVVPRKNEREMGRKGESGAEAPRGGTLLICSSELS